MGEIARRVKSVSIRDACEMEDGVDFDTVLCKVSMETTLSSQEEEEKKMRSARRRKERDDDVHRAGFGFETGEF